MIKIVIVSVNFVLSLLMITSIPWFEKETEKIQLINQKQLEDIEKMKKIHQINLWLKDVNSSVNKADAIDADSADANLIKFYDLNKKTYNLQIKKFIYEGEGLKSMRVAFGVQRDKLQDLETLFKLNYKEGYLQFRELEIDKKKITGEIELIQPFSGENNASQR